MDALYNYIYFKKTLAVSGESLRCPDEATPLLLHNFGQSLASKRPGVDNWDLSIWLYRNNFFSSPIKYIVEF